MCFNDSVVSHSFVNPTFVNIFGLKLKKGSNTLVLGYRDQVSTDGHIKVHIKIHRY